MTENPPPGLNWTRQSLDGILKYPWRKGENSKKPNKWGYYETEKDVFEWVRNGRPAMQRSPLAEIMDWADDITYAIHDLIDFFRVGRIPIDRFKGSSEEKDRFLEQVFGRKPHWTAEKVTYEAALEAVSDVFPFAPDEPYFDNPHPPTSAVPIYNDINQ